MTVSRRLLLIAALLLAAACLRAWLEWVGPLPGDSWAQGWIRNRGEHGGQLLVLARFFGDLATPPVAFGSVVVALVFVPARTRPFVVAAAAVVLFTLVLKHASGPTPLESELRGPHPDTWNFPSGHVTYATAFYGAVALIALRRRRPDIAAVLVGLIVLMGPMRVIEGEHFPSDVVAGYLAGGAWLLACDLGARSAPGLLNRLASCSRR